MLLFLVLPICIHSNIEPSAAFLQRGVNNLTELTIAFGRALLALGTRECKLSACLFNGLKPFMTSDITCLFIVGVHNQTRGAGEGQDCVSTHAWKTSGTPGQDDAD